VPDRRRGAARLLVATSSVAASWLVLGAPSGGAAETERPTARLVHVRGPGAEACADEAATRRAVAARLGYDPFQADASRTTTVTIRRKGAGYVATVELRAEGGEVAGVRTLSSPESDCRDLSSAIVLALAIAVDPLGGMPAPVPSTSASPSASAAPDPSTAPKSSPPSVPSAAPPSTPAPIATTEARSTQLAANLGAFALVGALPDLAFGIEGGVSFRSGDLGVALEGRADRGARAQGPRGGEVHGSILAGSIVPCVHREVLVGCVVATAGILRGRGGSVDVPADDATFYLASGLRLGIEVPLSSLLFLRAHVDGLATLRPTTLRILGEDAWTTPPFSMLFGLGAAARF
jgi:hypothetical protein